MILYDEQRGAQDFNSAFVDALGPFVGEPHEGKRFTRAQLAEAAGINRNTLGTYLRGEATIPGDALVRLIAVLPEEASNALLRRAGKKVVAIDPDADDWAGIGAEASMLTFEIFEAERDGRIDHRERAKLKKRCATLSAKLDGVQG